MKRDSSSGSTSIDAPSTPFSVNYVTRHTVTHNLGYNPLFRVYYEPFGDGTIWPCLGSRIGQEANNPKNTSQTGPYCIAWVNTTTLTIEIGYGSNTLTGTYPIYWVIYKDYSL